jgi:hypothetical protein
MKLRNCLIFWLLSAAEARIRGSTRALNEEHSVLVIGECTHANAVAAYQAAGKELLKSVDEVASLCSTASNFGSETVSYHDFVGDYQFTKNYFDGGTKWNYGSEDSLLGLDAASAKRFQEYGGATSRALEFPKGPQGTAEEVISNFEDCELDTAMCCFISGSSEKDANTEVCSVDLTKAPRSNHVANGWSVYNSNKNDATYCEGFMWNGDDDNSLSNIFKGNTLFEIAMRKNLSVNGRTRNVPGAPMCGCIEQMPVVTEAACTEAQEAYLFIGDPSTTSFTVTLDIQYTPCSTTLSNVAKLSEHVVGAGNCPSAVNDFLESRHYTLGSAWWYANPAEWMPIAGQGKQYWPNIGNSVLLESLAAVNDGIGAIIWRVCTSCTRSHRNIYYKRLTAVPDMDFLELLLNSWSSSNNVFNVDFELYSTYDDALAGTTEKRWKFCDFDDDHGFPFECGPEEQVEDMWNDFEDGGSYAKDVAFYLKKSGGVSEVS